MNNIAIIGAGQLGSRHLQGLKLAALPMKIFIVDNSAESLKVAYSRYQEVSENPNIESAEYLSSVDALPSELDLVIVATSSAPRRMILEELLAKKKVKNLVLEKVLFQSLKDYDAVSELLDKNNLQEHTWVNCPRRMFSGFLALSEELKSAKHIDFDTTGNEWGLACNAIHIIDLFALLTGYPKLNEFSAEGLEHKIYTSKRDGYIEFMGYVSGKNSRGDTMKISCLHGAPTGFYITVRTDSGDIYTIDETAGTITKNGTPWGLVNIKYQSGLTGQLAEEILSSDKSCTLVSYEQSAALHKAFLEELVPFYNNLSGKQGDSCPIT